MPPQLHMTWPFGLACPQPALPAGYTLRPLAAADDAGHIAVMQGAGFSDWSQAHVDDWKLRALPDGIFVIVDSQDTVVATAMALPRATQLHPDAGELGWVAASAEHVGWKLGRHRLCCHRPTLSGRRLPGDLSDDG